MSNSRRSTRIATPSGSTTPRASTSRQVNEDAGQLRKVPHHVELGFWLSSHHSQGSTPIAMSGSRLPSKREDVSRKTIQDTGECISSHLSSFPIRSDLIKAVHSRSSDFVLTSSSSLLLFYFSWKANTPTPTKPSVHPRKGEETRLVSSAPQDQTIAC